MRAEQTRRWGNGALAALAGVMLALALPKFSVAGLAWIAPGLLLLTTRRGDAFKLGYVAGLAHYLVSLSWLLQIPVAFYPILGWIALAGYLAVYPALWAWVAAWLVFQGGETTKTQRAQRGGSWVERLGKGLLCAAVWVGLEMTVCRMFSGFPWNLVGVTQHPLLPLVQVASLTGVYGVSFVVVWFSVSLCFAARQAALTPSARHLWLREIALPLLVVAVLYATGMQQMRRPAGEPWTLRVALVQPSIPQTMIWNENEAGTRFRELLELSRAALTNKPDLMIWPEAAVPGLVREDVEVQQAITGLAREHHVWIIIGADDVDRRGTNALYYNSSFLVSPAGELMSNYRKRRLVIFGEYVPLVSWLPFIKYLTPISGGFAAGEAPVSFSLADKQATTSVLICFEDTFAHYAREHAGPEVDFLVNITNDGWFGESAAQWQHAVNAAFRSIENRLPLVRASNNGITCWIDRNGAIQNAGFGSAADVYRAGYKVAEVPIVPAGERTATFYNRHGDWFGWGCVAVASVPVALRIRDWRRAKRARKAASAA